MKKPMRKVDQAKLRQRKHIAFRMNLLFFSIFILFSLLIFRLGYLQIVKGEDIRDDWSRKRKLQSIQVYLGAGSMTGQVRSLSIINL